jgi:hypothetical protein
MKVLVDFKLLQMLVECIDKQAELDKQDEATQARWKAIINETYITASASLTEFRKQNMTTDGRTETGMGPIVGPDKTAFV